MQLRLHAILYYKVGLLTKGFDLSRVQDGTKNKLNISIPKHTIKLNQQYFSIHLYITHIKQYYYKIKCQRKRASAI